jgi:predicted ATPase
MEARTSDVFVGRAPELERLEAILDTARAGRGATVLVAGEAGIGKTRLTSELASRARDRGFEVLLGRAIDLIGTELPYQPLAEALRPIGELPRAEGHQLRVFEDTLALLKGPVLLILEDVHWADTSTLDLVVYLAHNIHDRPVMLVATYRADEPASAERMVRLAHGVRRSDSALLVELGPLEHADLTALVAAYDSSRTAAEASAIVARSEGNPFFAQELLAADDNGLPRGLRELLLQRVNRLDEQARGVTRLAAAAGRAVGYPLLRAVAAIPEQDVRASLRQAVDHGVLVAEPSASSFRFRHALLAEAVYATLLPGEREEIHERLAEERAAVRPVRPSWLRTGRPRAAPRRPSPPRSPRHGRPKPSPAWPRHAGTWSGPSRCGRRCPMPPRSQAPVWPRSAPGPPRSPAASARRRGPWSSRGGRSNSWVTAIRTAPR